jgi:hypothetical protein
VRVIDLDSAACASIQAKISPSESSSNAECRMPTATFRLLEPVRESHLKAYRMTLERRRELIHRKFWTGHFTSKIRDKTYLIRSIPEFPETGFTLEWSYHLLVETIFLKVWSKIFIGNA